MFIIKQENIFQINFRISWVLRSKLDFETLIRLETPFSGLENTTAGLKCYISNKKTTITSTLQIKPIEIQINSNLENNHLLIVSNAVLKGKK